METDLELLVLAAKTGHYRPYWNPLVYDSEAFQLAVKLRLEISYAHDDRDRVFAERKGVACCGEDLTPAPYAATRRAIVRCAAEIGRTM